MRKRQLTYGVTVAVAAGSAVFAAPPPATEITTNTSSPNNCPLAVAIRQLPRIVPDVFGAVMGTEISYVAPDATEAGSVNAVAPMASPPVFWNLNPASHAHEPEFCTFHVLVK